LLAVFYESGGGLKRVEVSEAAALPHQLFVSLSSVRRRRDDDGLALTRPLTA
jgi:hypothetical protein